MAAVGLTRCAGLLLVLLVAVNGIAEGEYNFSPQVGQRTFFYEGTPGHVTTLEETTPLVPTTTTFDPYSTTTWTPPPGTTTFDPRSTTTWTPPPGTTTLYTGPPTTATVTPRAKLSEGEIIGISVVGGTAATAGLAVAGVMIHDSIKKKNAGPVTVITTTTKPIKHTGGRHDLTTTEEENVYSSGSGSSGTSSGTVSSDSSVPASASWLFWLLFLCALCCCAACVGAAFYLMKKKKKSRKVTKVEAAPYNPGPATDTMPLIAPPPVEAGPLTDSRVKLQAAPEYVPSWKMPWTGEKNCNTDLPSAYATTAAPAYYSAAPAVYTTAAPATTYTMAAPATVMQPANVTTVVAQPTADFGTPITAAPVIMNPARVIQGGLE